jgi:prevent-host-death family protein
MKALPVAELKRTFSDVLDAAERGEQTLVLRHGKPVAVISPVTNSAHARRGPLPLPREPGGLLSLVGLFDDWDTMEDDIAEIVAARQRAQDRPPPDFD